MTLAVRRFADLLVTPWRNGHGRKADIAATDGWHVGFAWLDADAPFSDFTGHERTITLLEGPGFTLEFVGHPALPVAEPFQPARFDGGWPTRCRLDGGPCVVLNAMTQRSQRSHRVTLASLDGRRVVAAEGAATYLVLLAGAATGSAGAETLALGPRDGLHVTRDLTLDGAPGTVAWTVVID